jgi:hypothetical protein
VLTRAPVEKGPSGVPTAKPHGCQVRGLNNGFACEPSPFHRDHLVKIEGICAKIGKGRARQNGDERPFAGTDIDEPAAIDARCGGNGSSIGLHARPEDLGQRADGLREVLPSTACIAGFDRWAFGAFRSFETISPEARLTIYEALPPANGIDFVTGHMAYSTLIQGRPAARFMTVLREPRSRILSQWMFGRSISDETLRPWGAWGRVVRLAREPFVEFLNYSEAAYQTDNMAVRMLLWPHPLIHDDGFIDSASDERLASEAAARLRAFDFVDVIENPQLEDNVRTFLSRPFVYRRVNETVVPSELRIPFKEELTAEALLLVEHRSRLDRELWRAVAAQRIAGADLTALRDDTFRRTVARYAALMRPDSTGCDTLVKRPGPATG